MRDSQVNDFCNDLQYLSTSMEFCCCCGSPRSPKLAVYPMGRARHVARWRAAERRNRMALALVVFFDRRCRACQWLANAEQSQWPQHRHG